MRLPRIASLLACLFLLLLLAMPTMAAASVDHPTQSEQREQLLPPIQDPSDEETPAPQTPAVTPSPSPDVLSPIGDNDGDGIPNAQDPDDDNGGTSDEDDPEPFDPVVEPTPSPDILSPIQDSDGDGIPNVQDPDDDNDAVEDDDDPSPFVPGTKDPNPPPTRPGGTTGGGKAPAVTALPMAGAGDPERGLDLIPIAAGIVTISVALGAWISLHEQRTRAARTR